jgi:hypothetical protein
VFAFRNDENVQTVTKRSAGFGRRRRYNHANVSNSLLLLLLVLLCCFPSIHNTYVVFKYTHSIVLITFDNRHARRGTPQRATHGQPLHQRLIQLQNLKHRTIINDIRYLSTTTTIIITITIIIIIIIIIIILMITTYSIGCGVWSNNQLDADKHRL